MKALTNGLFSKYYLSQLCIRLYHYFLSAYSKTVEVGGGIIWAMVTVVDMVAVNQAAEDMEITSL